ncbi:hypothetical protein D3C75_1179820 [compost metagenome]
MNSTATPSIKITEPLPNAKNVVALMTSVLTATIKAMNDATPRFCDSAGFVGFPVRSAKADNSRSFAAVQPKRLRLHSNESCSRQRNLEVEFLAIHAL